MPKLESLLTLEYGAALSAETRTGQGYPVFGSSGEVGRHSSYLVPEAGIVVGRKGTVGKVTWSGEPFWPIDTAYWVNCSRENKRWLYWVLSWLPLDRLDTSTGIPGLNRNDVYALSIDLPPQGERCRIAEILDTVDTVIRETEAIIAKLNLIKQGLLHDLLTRGIDEGGELRQPRSEAPHLYKESPLGWIPKDWTPAQLGTVAALKRGHDIVEANFVPGPYPVISSSGIGGYHNVSTSSGPNVVVGRKGSIGTVHYVETDFWAHDTSLFVTNFFGNDERFIFYLFTYLRLEQYGTKSGSPSLNRNDVHPLWIGRPNRSEQELIVRVLLAHDATASDSADELEKLERLKLGLMDDLLTGRVRVTPLFAREE
ncbi:restriction endonuclease subunit S [Paraburkholderia sp. J8-2]|uniref:restriction endonuclease subunit S n=1 Tax=Paraburkholderia sp. J8-2 TaxID=2805440 RepID=UPI002AB7E63C|nr:restriction endonuclease subunit S [Paraburkholderia sp. J8-2]